jgi:hypothetical protein
MISNILTHDLNLIVIAAERAITIEEGADEFEGFLGIWPQEGSWLKVLDDGIVDVLGEGTARAGENAHRCVRGSSRTGLV